jgi:hypothetical protein
MVKFIEKTRKRSYGARMAITIIITAVIILPIFFIWFMSLNNDLGGTLYVDKKSQESKKEESSLPSFPSALKSVLGNMWSSVESLLEPPFNESVEMNDLQSDINSSAVESVPDEEFFNEENLEPENKEINSSDSN